MQSSSPTRRAGDRVSAIKTVSGVISTFTLCVRACVRTSHAGGVCRVVSATKSWRLLLFFFVFFKIIILLIPASPLLHGAQSGSPCEVMWNCGEEITSSWCLLCGRRTQLLLLFVLRGGREREKKNDK